MYFTHVFVTAGMYMGATQMGYVPAAGYGQYQALGGQQGMMGPVMAPQMNVMGQAGVMPQPGAAAAAPPYMAGVQGSMMGMQNGMMGGMPAVPQQPYGTQQAQQMQWNISQVTQLEPGTTCRQIRRLTLTAQNPYFTIQKSCKPNPSHIVLDIISICKLVLLLS